MVNVLTISSDLPLVTFEESKQLVPQHLLQEGNTCESSFPYVLILGPGIWGNACDGNVPSSKIKYTHQAERKRVKCMPSLPVVA